MPVLRPFPSASRANSTFSLADSERMPVLRLVGFISKLEFRTQRLPIPGGTGSASSDATSGTPALQLTTPFALRTDFVSPLDGGIGPKPPFSQSAINQAGSRLLSVANVVGAVFVLGVSIGDAIVVTLSPEDPGGIGAKDAWEASASVGKYVSENGFKSTLEGAISAWEDSFNPLIGPF
jgi:hypothetical protein